MNHTAPTVPQAARLAIPAYFGPGTAWQRLAAGAPTVGLAIVNMASGPGHAVDTGYAPAIAAARDAGVQVLGYVDTAFGERSTVDIVDDVETYWSWYGTTGYMLDRGHVTGDRLRSRYTPVIERIRATTDHTTVVINAGAVIDECFMQLVDIVGDFEGSYEQYLSTTLPRWRAAYDPSRFWHIVYDVPEMAVDRVLDRSAELNAGWLFVTDQAISGDGPGSYLYDRLPNDRVWNRLIHAEGSERTTT